MCSEGLVVEFKDLPQILSRVIDVIDPDGAEGADGATIILQ